MSHHPSTDRPTMTIPMLLQRVRDGQRLVMTTAYDAVTARLADPVVDMILVGDSVGNVCLGFDNTLPVSMAMMNHHVEAVARTRPSSLLVADMPYLSYHLSLEETLRNAGGFLQRGAAAVKLEGGGKRADIIRTLVEAEIPVMSHLGLTPQSVHAMGGFKVQGRGADGALQILEDAHRLQDAGCFALVLEGIPSELAARITESLSIPTIGIGAGPHCAGQVLVLHDVLGLTQGHQPKFVRTYVDGFDLLQQALAHWAEDVRRGAFPSPTESYALPADVHAAIAAWMPHHQPFMRPSMLTFRTIKSLTQCLRGYRASGLRIGFVPTMGFLHAGHRALIRESVARCDITVVSIFVNPTQFGPNEDLDRYPRALEQDHELCRNAGVTMTFMPNAGEIYPPGFQTYVEPGPIAEPLCGAVRPGHFRGVATVVTKLFNIVQPDMAFFGQKDFQQCAVIRQMVRDLNLPIEIVTVPTVREPDGLALSSRNSYLSAADRERARCLSQGLFAAQAAFREGQRDSSRLTEVSRAPMTEVDQLQYLELRDAGTLEAIQGAVEQPAALCVAAFVGPTRLIDNVILDLSSDGPEKDRKDLITTSAAASDHLSTGVA
jgi:pantoate--beta-alanine ligase/3-methyl-2-oxobutanoate hydroxymethyltransferase